ncbi:MAG TPA: 6,7-dimethyl-8-ribityllumazine synthase [Actinomycetota bacterium]|nr:6,7-dimethyl-8-ribityllumazine synthase [Actinomycetota bacterium]
MTEHRGEPAGAGRRVAIVVARFHESVTANLLEGARTQLGRRGVADDSIEVAWVPGAFEIPLVAERFAVSGRFDAVICLGAVARGETLHYELVANEAARGVAAVARRTGVPVIFEVLAADSLELLEARAGGVHGNRGRDAAEAALEMADLLDRLPAPSRQEALR